MLLKNLMEDKQLDFNQPFLSVRRHNTSTAATPEPEAKRKPENSRPKIPSLPIYKSELKSGPIRNPGSVPFVWEKSPGRPKSKSPAVKRPPVAPKLPPGRILQATQPPGRILQATQPPSDKSSIKSQSETGNLPPSSQNASSLDRKYDGYKDRMEETETGSYSSEDGDEAYVDARDTLSRTESLFYNCSERGVSGLDGPDVKPSGIFLSDPQTRDLMMGRFLPAAKAMASETPPYTFKKPLVAAQEQARPVQKMVSVNKLYQRTAAYNGPYHPPDKTWEESEDEYDDYGGSDHPSFKACGLISRLCMKSSLCLLNPLPGVRMQAQPHASSVRRTKAKSSYPSSSSKTDNEHARDIVYEKTSRLGNTDQHEVKMERKNESRQITGKHDSPKVDGSTLRKLLQGGELSPYNNGVSQSVLREDEASLGSPDTNLVVDGHGPPHREGGYNFGELLACDSSRWESASSSPVVEKTLYIDSVHTLKSRSSDSSSSDIKGLIHYEEDDIEAPVKDVNDLTIVDAGAKLQYKSLESVDLSFHGSSGRSTNDVQKIIQDELTYSEIPADGKVDSERLQSMKLGDHETYHENIQESLALSGSKVINDWKIGAEIQPPSTQEASHSLNYSHSPLAPPLPKSPSDSWLKRALPSASAKHSRLSLGNRHCYTNQASNASPKVQHGHLKFPELHQELLTSIPEV